MSPRAIGVQGPPSGGPLSGLAANDTAVVTYARSIGGAAGAARIAGLTPLPGGERTPAAAGRQTTSEGALPGGPSSTGPARPDGQPLLRPLAERPGETSPARPGRVGPAVPLPRNTSGRYVCCGGYGEHFLFCDEADR